MNITKLKATPKKLKKMSQEELTHTLQLVEIEIENYKIATRNYSEEKVERFSVPYLRNWNRFKESIIVLKEK